MTTHPSVQDLEALVAGTLDEDRSILISAHTDDCAACGRELDWLRAERELFAQRARGVPPSEVWDQIEARIANRIRQREPGPRGLRRLLRSAFENERVQWFAVAGAALAVLGMVAVSPLSPLRKMTPEAANGMQPQSMPVAVAKAHGTALGESAMPDDNDPPTADAVVSNTKVSGPISLMISTLAAEVEIVVGPPDEAKVTLSDSSIQAVRWLPPTSTGTAWRLDFGGGSSLPDGHLRLELPAGSQIDVHSASGDVHVAGLQGDAAVTTESGEIFVRDAKSAKLVSESGDIELRDTAGAIEVKTDSGELNVHGEILQPIRYKSISGDLMLSGPCRVATCKITAETVSGNVTLSRNEAHALGIRLRAHHGEISGTFGLPVEMKRTPGQPTEWTTRLGAGTGTLELVTQSGDIVLDTP